MTKPPKARTPVALPKKVRAFLHSIDEEIFRKRDQQGEAIEVTYSEFMHMRRACDQDGSYPLGFDDGPFEPPTYRGLEVRLVESASADRVKSRREITADQWPPRDFRL